MTSPPPRLRVQGVARSFGATRALDGVDLEVAAGEVHAVLGENGAGKSTLMRILAGALRPDAGRLELDGASYAPAGPLAARRAGVAVVHQELNLAPHLTVAENLVLGVEAHRLGWLRPGAWRPRIAAVLGRLGHPELRPDVPVGRLAPAARQLVEIARALLGEARLLVLDEPTSSLGLEDIHHLFRIVRDLAAGGVSVLYVSHFLEEVREVADRYTVLRDGRTVAAGSLAGTSLEELVGVMLGRRLEEMYPRVAREPGEVLLRVEDLHGRRLPAGVSLELRRGEILGLAGLVGAGRTELLRVLHGLDPVRRGRIRVAAVDLAGLGPPARLAAGVGMLSEDRKEEGLALDLPVADNLLLGRHRRYARAGWLPARTLRRVAADWLARLDIRARGPEQPARDLSGGNQQKLALARLLHHEAEVLLLDEPTRGVDVGSKAAIWRLVGELAARGRAVLVASGHAPELLGTCDRIAVLHRGRVVAVRPASAWTEHAILEAAARGRAEEAA